MLGFDQHMSALFWAGISHIAQLVLLTYFSFKTVVSDTPAILDAVELGVVNETLFV